jgi:hypothetical protein
MGDCRDLRVGANGAVLRLHGEHDTVGFPLLLLCTAMYVVGHMLMS